jgi:hypothetical protein
MAPARKILDRADFPSDELPGHVRIALPLAELIDNGISATIETRHIRSPEIKIRIFHHAEQQTQIFRQRNRVPHELANSPRMVSVAVVDNGVGISPREEFQQVITLALDPQGRNLPVPDQDFGDIRHCVPYISKYGVGLKNAATAMAWTWILVSRRGCEITEFKYEHYGAANDTQWPSTQFIRKIGKPSKLAEWMPEGFLVLFFL